MCSSVKEFLVNCCLTAVCVGVTVRVDRKHFTSSRFGLPSVVPLKPEGAC